MISTHPALETFPAAWPQIPDWARPSRDPNPEDWACFAGAAFAYLDVALRAPGVPLALLRDRLALRAAVACTALTGRPESAGALRDAVHLRCPGDSAGPAGETYLQWRRAVARPVSCAALHAVLPGHDLADVTRWRAAGAGEGMPVARAVAVLEAVLSEAPRAETDALILAEAALVDALGWPRITPVLTPGLAPRDLRRTGADLWLACHRAIVAAAGEAVQLVSDLSRRGERLRAAAPCLRARGAEEAVETILRQDAVTPGALSVLRSDRAARRFCDRLVALGVVRELTGRDTSRLYGI
ncbi:DUF1403 family protein [Roseovarius sp. D22-M7]|uniref:DUF1403 family protein n=1 Tax=Roseovarius sp. D22-M7 TaxID=3127116 RepID=UPI003010358C